jgi:hypothetical protein
MDITPYRTRLSNLEKRDKESIREYTQRWRESAAQVHPPLLDKEMISLFANTLKAPYLPTHSKTINRKILYYHPDEAVKMSVGIDHVIFSLSLSSK